MKKKYLFGAHSLSALYTIDNYDALVEVMKTAVKFGCKVFELPFLLVRLTWEEVAKAAKDAGIKEIVICHFWPVGSDGKPNCGDPLGTDEEMRAALDTLESIIDAANVVRANGVIVRTIDGPTWGCLGKDYSTELAPDKMREKVVFFLQLAGSMCAEAGLILAVEFLRPGEDKVTMGTEDMLAILVLVNHPAVMMHFDVYHSVMRGENPAEMIKLAGPMIGYLHLHGTDRLAPGQVGDKCDWKVIIAAINEYVPSDPENPTVCVSEPFGEVTCAANPVLGAGLPKALPLDEYLAQARKTFDAEGLEFDLALAV